MTAARTLTETWRFGQWQEREQGTIDLFETQAGLYHYEIRFDDGTVYETKTIGSRPLDQMREFAFRHAPDGVTCFRRVFP